MSRREAREAAAHRYADAGWHVFPTEPGGKRPIPEHGFLDATTSHKQIQNWWRSEPRSNLAVATGAPGPDVLDVDKHKEGDGFAAFNQLKRAGLVRDPMAIVRTPSGGFHAYYKGTEHQRNGHIPGVYVDFRSQGGYVVAPPSRIAGRDYEIARKQPSADTFDWAAAKQVLHPQPERQPYKPPERNEDAAPRPGSPPRLARQPARRQPQSRTVLGHRAAPPRQATRRLWTASPARPGPPGSMTARSTGRSPRHSRPQGGERAGLLSTRLRAPPRPPCSRARRPRRTVLLNTKWRQDVEPAQISHQASHPR